MWLEKKVSDIVFISILIHPFLMFMTRLDLLPRSIVELFYIAAAAMVLLFFLQEKLFVLLLIAGIILFRFILVESIYLAIYDLAMISLLIFYSHFYLALDRLNFAIFFLIIIEFCFGLYSYVSGDLVDFNRVGGAFPSSMHFAFATAGLSFALFFSNIKYKLLLFSILILSAFLTGSRSAMLSVIVLSYFVVIERFGLVKSSLIFLTGLIVFLIGEISFRSLSYIEGSDSVRFSGYLEWFERQDAASFLLGRGRYFLGSIGVVNNAEDSLITESSVLTYIEAYGVLSAFLILLAPYLAFYKNLNFKIFFLSGTLFFLLSFLSPFLETPSILFVNVVLIISALKLSASREC